MKSSDDTRSSSLDISDVEMRQLATSVSELVNEYFARVPQLPVFPETSGGAASREEFEEQFWAEEQGNLP